MPIEKTHISTIKAGDTVLYRGATKTVGPQDIKQDADGTVTLFGDSFKLGHALVEKVNFPRFYRGRMLE